MLRAPARTAARAAATQLRAQLPTQLAARLHKQRLIDRLVADPQLPILGILEPESGRDLLRRPARPQPGLHRSQQPRRARKLARLGPPRAPLRAPLGRQRPIRPPPPAAANLAPHRRTMPPQRPRDLAIALTGRDPTTDPLTLGKRQPPRRMRRPPPRQRRLLPDPLHRPRRTPKLRRQHPHPRPRPQPPRDSLALIRTHPPIPPAHNTSDRSTTPDRVASTG
jgi:hypothetical protein